MLPSREELVGLSPTLLHDFMALTLNPASLSVIAWLVDHGIFEQLDDDGRDPQQLGLPDEGEGEGEDAELAEVALEMALDLGLHLGLLARRAGRVYATPLGQTFLCSRSRLRLLGHVQHYASYLPSAGRIHEALGQTRRSRRSMWTTGQDRRAYDRYFAARQAYNESRRAYFWDTSYLLMRAHLRRDLSGHRRACDVGAGPAGFAGLLARSVPDLEVHAVDASLAHEDYRTHTENALRDEGVKVQLWGSNALNDPMPPSLDLLTFNRLLSGVPREGIDVWIEKAHSALVPGGVVAAVDFVTVGDPTHDRFVAQVVSQWMGKDRYLLATQPLVSADDDKHQWGWSRPWRAEELGDAMRRGGFVDVGITAADPPFALVYATRA